ncbi:MAG: N-acetyltransferase [Myxococcota bacterium]
MSEVRVRAIELPREAVPFVKSWWPIYADDPHWVPPLMMERKVFFDPGQNPYFRKADIRCFVAERGGEIVGTIAATVDHRQQEIEPGLGFFGFFEFRNDPEVARALLQAALGFLSEKGMKLAKGPYNFSTNHEFGLVIDGFDTDPCIANPHNSAYYQGIYEQIGLRKAIDWYAYWLDKGPIPTGVNAISERFMKRHPQVTLRKLDAAKFDQEVELFYEIYNDAWENNWGHVHLDHDEFLFQVNAMKPVVNADLCWFAYVGEEVAGVAITLPDFNQVAKKMNGSIFPFGWWHYLTGRGRIDALRVFVLGIKQKFQHLPLGAPLYIKTWEEGMKLPIRGAECSLVVDDNHKMRGALEKLGGRIYKTYRVYEVDVPARPTP